MRPAVQHFLRNPHPFYAITRIARPAAVAHVQTDGSYRSDMSRTAVVLRTTAAENYTLSKTYFEHKNCTHAEWCSVLDGIQFSIKKEQGAIELENDCIGIVKALTTRRMPLDRRSAQLYTAIYKEIRGLDYFGIRWIPREMNKADELFRL